MENGESRNFIIRFVSDCGFLIQHSQTTNTFHPSFLSKDKFFLSRPTFPSLLFCQNSALVCGFTLPYLQLCMCQKQPWTKIIFLRRGNTKSGFPDRFLTCNLYLYPILCIKDRTTISGRVSLSQILAVSNFSFRCEIIYLEDQTISSQWPILVRLYLQIPLSFV